MVTNSRLPPADKLPPVGDLLAAALAATQDPAGILDSTLRIRFANASLADTLGHPLEALEGMAWSSLGSGNPVSRLDDALRRTIAHGGPESVLVVFGEGTAARHVDFMLTPLHDDAGTVTAVMVLGRNVSRLQRGRIALREVLDRIVHALKDAPVHVFTQDREGRYTWINKALGARRLDDFVGRRESEIFEAEDARRLASLRQDVMATGSSLRTEIQLWLGDQYRYFDLTLAPMPGPHSRGVVGAAIDITELRENREALAAAKAEAERANIAKTRFLAAASHDLRQPFQAMRLFAHLLLEEPLDARARDLAEKLREAMEASESLLDTLLDASALEAGTVQPECRPFAITETLARLQREWEPQAAAKGLFVRCRPLDVIVHSDPVLLERMLRNLLSNAVRYTRRGGVLIACRRRGTWLRIAVYDTGPGIPPDQLNAIFDDFHQLATATHERSKGLGLGLGIVQRMGRLLDHPVHVASRLGRGSVFAVDVPLAEPRPATDGQTNIEPISNVLSRPRSAK